MNAPRTRFRLLFRLLTGVASGLGGGGIAAGATAEPAAVTSGKRLEERGISGAQREFEALKAARDPARPATSGLPRLAAPELHATPPAAARPGGTGTMPPPDRTGKATGNWLLDAMQQQERRKERTASGELRDSNRPGSRRHDGSARAFATSSALDHPEAPDDDGNLAAPDRASGGPDARPSESAAAGGETAAGAVNPLSPYLAEWMAPGDYAMLKSVLDASARRDANGPGIFGGGSGTGPGWEAPAVRAPMSPGLGIGDTRANTALPPGVGGAAGSPSNPYLEALSVPRFEAPGAGGFAAPVAVPAFPPPASSAASVPVAPVDALPMSKSKRPDFVRPLEDEKPFKTLKRF